MSSVLLHILFSSARFVSLHRVCNPREACGYLMHKRSNEYMSDYTVAMAFSREKCTSYIAIYTVSQKAILDFQITPINMIQRR